MNDSMQSELEDIRSKVINDLTPLMEDGELDPEQRFMLALASARNSSSVEQFKKALLITAEITDKDRRADALLDLLEELDFALDSEQIELDGPADLLAGSESQV